MHTKTARDPGNGALQLVAVIYQHPTSRICLFVVYSRLTPEGKGKVLCFCLAPLAASFRVAPEVSVIDPIYPQTEPSCQVDVICWRYLLVAEELEHGPVASLDGLGTSSVESSTRPGAGTILVQERS